MLLQTIAQTAIDITVNRPSELPDASPDGILDGILNLVFIAIAGISTIVLVLQGVRYSLSAGEPEKANQARNGIIYSLIGITVATTAWSLMNFTLDKVIRDTSTISETSTLTNLLGDIAGYIIFVGAVISVIMIFVGGIKLNISGGNSQQAKKARDMIIYAIIGMVLTISAGPILVFVLDKLAN